MGKINENKTKHGLCLTNYYKKKSTVIDRRKAEKLMFWHQAWVSSWLVTRLFGGVERRLIRGHARNQSTLTFCSIAINCNGKFSVNWGALKQERSMYHTSQPCCFWTKQVCKIAKTTTRKTSENRINLRYVDDIWCFIW